MDQNGFVFLYCIFYELKYSFGGSIFCIENDLVFEVQPLESKIDHSSAFPMILHLFPRTINNVRYFVGHHKFQVLSTIMKRLES